MSRTPGPWCVEICEYGGNPYVGAICGPEGQMLVETDARLIAAAPELLALIEDALIEHDDTYDGGPLSPTVARFVDRARALVAKAVGGT